MPEPLVSVKMITYNHAPYIAQAIEGVLMQKTNFPFELVIGEDCSTDGTREIVFDYALRYPKVIRVVSSKNNVGMHENSARTAGSCQGKYIAYCEGDDYWVNSSKLQKQVDLLENNLQFIGCFHNVEVINENTSFDEKIYLCDQDQKKIVTAADILRRNIIPTLSIVMRRDYNAELPQWINNLKMRDWPISFLASLKGDWAYISLPMGVYRKHIGGIWTKMTLLDQINSDIEFFETVYKYFDEPYKTDSLIYASKRHSSAAEYCYYNRLYSLEKMHIKKTIDILVKNRHFSLPLYKAIVQYLSPGIFFKLRTFWRKFTRNRSASQADCFDLPA